MSLPPNTPRATTSTTFGEIVASCDLFQSWTKYEEACVEEEDSDLEGDVRYATMDIVFEPGNEFNKKYSHTDGLGALPRRPKSPTRSSEPPASGKAKMAGKYEDSIRIGLKVQRTRLLETDSKEVEWDYQGRGTYGKFFAGWETLVPYDLKAAGNLVQTVIDENQKRWDGAALKVDVLGNGAEIGGFFGIIRDLFTFKDWLSLYRAQARTIFSCDGRDVTVPGDLRILENQEHHLFDTTKYNGDTEMMTVITYGSGQYGTASLFRVNLTPHKPGKPSKAALMDVLAYAKQVPRPILRRLRMNGRIELVQKKGKIRCLYDGGQFQPSPVRVSTQLTNKKNKKVLSPWENIGDGWRSALGIAIGENDDDALVATIPQMMALLHLKGSALHNFESTPIEEFETPLLSVHYDEDDAKSNPEWNIKRGLKIIKGPDRDGHNADRAKVVVLFPQDSLWAKELLLWA
ncbi:hypothetical protein V502_00159 [Pseudogymnoascus sp. VKM F-4520 (FW-2644)]|nr:hypothetical protein V502_00159 [Pseudogymnoascus sp. VKM F-4520 (FW-2644)]